MGQAEPISHCARILLSTTKDWKPGDGNASTLADARTMLAPIIYALDGSGFPPPSSDDVTKQDAWKACVAAAQAGQDGNGNPRDPVGRYVVFWVADANNPARLDDQAHLGLNWPFQPDSHIVRVSGPILDGTDPKPKRLFFFDSIAKDVAIEADGSAREGLWSLQQGADAGATTSTDNQGSTNAAALTAPRPWLASFLFAIWVVSGCVLALWLWLASNMMGLAAVSFKAEAANANCLSGGAAWTGSCGQAWLKALQDQLNTGNKFYHTAGSFFLSLSGENAHLFLLVPYVLTMISIVVLMLAAGLAIKGVWFGVLIDDRRRMSLSQTQQVVWTVLLLGALAVMGWCNAAGLSVVAHDAHIWEIFPTMPGALWAALGINLVATPYLSDLILAKKDPQRLPDTQSLSNQQNNQSSGILGLRQIVPARLATNTSPTDASWVDLVSGETVGKDQQLDVSRVQHLVISGALVTTYFMALANQLGDMAGIVNAVAAGKALFTATPEVGNGTFLGLLGVSHAGYLVFKARAPEGSDNTAGSGQPQS